MDLGIKTKDHHGTCETHGDYTTIKSFMAGDWRGGECPACTDEYLKREEVEYHNRQRMETINALLANSGVPERYIDSTLENYIPGTANASKIHRGLTRYVRDFKMHRESGMSIFMIGLVGTGKTHLGAAIVSGVIKTHAVRAHFTTVVKMLRRVRSTYNRSSEETESDVLRHYMNVDLLVIDEVGVQSGSDHEHNIIFEIINERYANRRPTVLISNLGAEDLRVILGERIMDRFRDGRTQNFDWQSYRGSK